MVRVSWVDAGVTELGVGVGLLVDFVVTINVQLCKWGSPEDDNPDSTVVARVTRDARAVVRVRWN